MSISVVCDAPKGSWDMVSALATTAAVVVALGIPTFQGCRASSKQKAARRQRQEDIAHILLPIFMRLRARLLTMRETLYEAQSNAIIHPAAYMSLQLSTSAQLERMRSNLEDLPAVQRKHLAVIIGWSGLWDDNLTTMFVKLDSSDFYSRVINPDSRLQESLITPLIESTQAMLEWCMHVARPGERIEPVQESMLQWPEDGLNESDRDPV